MISLECNIFVVGQYGFFLPPSQIIPTSLELIDGIVAMVKEAETLKYF